MLRFHDEVAGGTGQRPSGINRTAMIRPFLVAALALTGVLAVTPTPHSSAATLDDTPWRLPAPPPRCTTAQADSGDVADCVLVAYPDPSSTGWGHAPAPGVGTGWNWQGYWYNGSPALAGWEATYIAENTTPVAGFGPGYLETHRDAQALFEGFLNEISANGYRVWGVSGYSFRCTSGNGGWSCPSGDPDDLSNHAWGLAIDMNAGTNPIRGYSGVDGQTACLTPIQTDLPQWVIETAERWGLYWGGYGWNSGCQSLDTWRTSVYRDPPHFEFRGTPAQARAIAEFNQQNDPRRRCWNTVAENGETVERCNLNGTPEADWRLPVEVDAPDGAAAALVNLTATGSTARGHLSIDTCAPTEGRSTSAVNFAAGETTAAMAIAPLDGNRFCVGRSTDVHSIVDVVGYLTESGERLWYEPLADRRLLDTRRDPACVGDACITERLGTRDQRPVIPDDPAPRLVNLTITDGVDRGHARLGDCESVADGQFSHINYVGGRSRANLALLPGGPDEPCVWTRTESNVVVDELGRLDAEIGLGWDVQPAERILDTRRCTDAWCEGVPTGGQPFTVDLGATAPAMAVTLTVTGAEQHGYAWIGSTCDALVDGKPATSTVNYAPGAAAANMTIVVPDDGQVCIVVRTDAHVIIDRQAELVDDQTVGLTPATPLRVHDTRD
jgi:hypothetical protein